MPFRTHRSTSSSISRSPISSRRVAILAGTIAALSPSLSPATDTVRTWDVQDNTGAATINNNFYNNLNWDGDVRPTFTGNSDAYLFSGVGSAVVLNINGGLTEYVAKNIAFTAGTYTFTGAQNLTLGDATTSLLNTGIIRNASTGTQTFNSTGKIAFNFGGVVAEAGNVVFGTNTVFDVGNGAATTGRNVQISGAFNVTINGVLAGAGTDVSDGGALLKSGIGTLLLQADNSAWNGRIEAQDGVIRINKGLALGSTSGKTYLSGGNSSSRIDFNAGIAVPETFVLCGRSSPVAQLGNFGGNNVLTGEIRLAPGGSEYGFTSAAGTLTVSGPITFAPEVAASNLTLSGAGDGTIASVITDSGAPTALSKTGAGTWTLSGTNTATGPILVAAGRLNLTTSSAGNNAVTVSDGATLGLSASAASTTLRASSLTLGSSTGATLSLDLGATPGIAPFITTNLLSATGSQITIRGSLAIGQYTLIDYSGSIGGAGFAGLSLGSLPARATGQLVNDSAGTKVILSITAFDLPKWTGAVSSDWDFDDTVNGGLPATTNWREVKSNAATTYLQGPGGTDSVLFDDTASATANTVNLVGTLTPAAVTVNNSVLNYTFAGIGKVSGAGSLTKTGTGSLTLANFGVNDYSGGTTIGNGSTVIIGDGLTDGAGSLGSGRIVNDGSLVLNRPDNFTLATPIDGSGTLVKRTAGTTTLSGNSGFTGSVVVEAGTLKLGNPNSLGLTSGGTTVLSGATIDVGGQRTPAGEIITITGAGVNGGGALINTGTGNLGVGFRNVSLAGPATFGGTTRFDIRDNPGGLDANGFTLSKVGANSIFLANIGETHIGDLQISGGRIAFEGNTTLGDKPGQITVESGAELGLEDSQVVHTKAILLKGGTINITAGTQNVIAGPITLQGSGTIRTAANTTTLISGLISGTGDLSKIVGGILILASDSQYNGRTSLTQGTLRVGNDGPSGSLGTGEISLEPASGVTATLAFRRSDANLVVSNVITSTGAGTNVINIGATNGTVPASAVITFTGANSFTGALNVNGGSLRITNSSALGVGQKIVSVATNGKPSLRLNATTDPIDLSSDISLITSNDDATYPAIVNEAGNNTIRGTIGLSNGNGGNTRISASAGTSLTLAGAIAPASTATSGRTLILDGAGNGLITGILSDLSAPTARVLSLTKSGTGTWTLDSASTFTGPTAIQAGTLKLGPTGSIAASGTISVNAGANLDVSANSSFTLAGTQTLTGAGVVLGSISSAAGATISPATATTTGTLTVSGNLQLAPGGRLVTNLGTDASQGNVSDIVSVGGNLTLSSATIVTLSPTGSLLSGDYRILNYQGTLDSSAGLPTIAHNTRYQFALDTSTAQQINLKVTGTASTLTWSAASPGATWNTKVAANWNGGAETFYDLDAAIFDDSSAGHDVTLEGTVIPSSVHVNTANSYRFIGTGGIAGAQGGFFKEGLGTLTIANSNTYTGATEVSAGTLLVNGSISGSAVRVKSGATLGGTGTITTNNQPFLLDAGSHLAPGNGPGNLTINVGTATLDLSAAVATNGSSALQFELGPANTNDRITLGGGTLNIGVGVLGLDDFAFQLLTDFAPGTYTLFQTAAPILGSLDTDPARLIGVFGSYSGSLGFSDDRTDIVLTVVPEPSALASALVTGVAFLGFRRKSRRRL